MATTLDFLARNDKSLILHYCYYCISFFLHRFFYILTYLKREREKKLGSSGIYYFVLRIYLKERFDVLRVNAN